MAKLRWELASAYLVTGCRAGSWLVATGLVARYDGPIAFALLVLIRGAFSLMNYVTGGLAPAILRCMAEADAVEARTPSVEGTGAGPIRPSMASPGDRVAVLAYASPGMLPEPTAPSSVALAVRRLSRASLAAGIAGGIGYVVWLMLSGPLALRGFSPFPALAVGAGIATRAVSDLDGAIIQSRGRLLTDNLLIASADLLWIVLCVIAVGKGGPLIGPIASAYFVSGLGLMVARWLVSVRLAPPSTWGDPGARQWQWRILAGGATLVVAAAADYLYAPTALVMIGARLTLADVTAYGAVLQIDAALLMSVTAVSAVLLPRAARMAAAGHGAGVWQAYVRGTLWTGVVLLLLAAAAWASAGPLLRAWLGKVPDGAVMLVPYILAHTVVGGTTGVGRAALLACGRMRTWATSAILAGVVNAAGVAAVLVATDWGLRGVALVTLAVVTVRNVLWMPLAVRAATRGVGTP